MTIGMQDRMTWLERLNAAKDAILGKVPQQKGQAHPFFWGQLVQNAGLPQTKVEMNAQKLRALSETPIVRRAVRYVKSQVSRQEKGIIPKPGVKITALQRKQIQALNNVLESPNAEDNWVTLVEKWIEDLLVLGWSTTVVKEWNEHPEHPLLLFPSDAASFQIYLDWDGSPGKRRWAQHDLRGNRVDFLPNELFVIRFDPRTADPFGVSPLAVCSQEVEYLLAAMAYSGDVASKAAPKKLLHLGEDADPEFVKEVRMYWRDEIAGRGEMPILGGTKAPTSIELGFASDQSLFLDWQRHLIAIIANAFGIDVQKMNMIVGINRSTGDTLDQVSDESALLPVTTAIETAINNYLLRRFGLYEVAEFKFKFVTSVADRKALAVMHQIMLQDDEVTINEARAEMGLPPLAQDPALPGKSKGDCTLSEYRAKYGSALGVDSVLGEEDGGNGVYSAKGPKDKAYNKGKELSTDAPRASAEGGD